MCYNINCMYELFNFNSACMGRARIMNQPIMYIISIRVELRDNFKSAISYFVSRCAKLQWFKGMSE